MLHFIFLALFLSWFSLLTMEIKLTTLNRSANFIECYKQLKTTSNKKDIEAILAAKTYSSLSKNERSSFDRKANKKLLSLIAASNVPLMQGAINWK